MKFKRHNLAALLVFMLATLFLYTGFNKLVYPEQLYHAIKGIAVMAPIAEAVTLCIPLLEIIIACFLLFPPLKEAGMLLSFLLLLVFTVYTGYILVSPYPTPCTCTGIVDSLSWKQHFMLNLLLLLLNLWLILPFVRLKNIIAITR